jgi:Protein of unknown function (DUF2505)
VRFRTQHRFRASVDAVVDVLVDPEFHQELALPDVRLLDVVDQRDDGDAAFLALRYEYVGRLDANVGRLLRGRRLTWIQELGVERATGDGPPAWRERSGRLRFAAENAPDRLHGDARFGLHADEDHTVWDLSGDVKVRVPLVGPGAERAITAGFLERLEVEVREIAERVRPPG